MGLLNKLFSSTPEFPPIDPQSPAAQRVAEVQSELGELAGKVAQPLEVVPSEHAAYVFIGKPPKKFGLAWIHDGQVSGLNTLVEQHGMKPSQVEGVIEDLRQAYQRSADAQRFTADLPKRSVVVTPSPRLEAEVHQVIEKITH